MWRERVQPAGRCVTGRAPLSEARKSSVTHLASLDPLHDAGELRHVLRVRHGYSQCSAQKMVKKKNATQWKRLKTEGENIYIWGGGKCAETAPTLHWGDDILVCSPASLDWLLFTLREACCILVGILFREEKPRPHLLSSVSTSLCSSTSPLRGRRLDSQSSLYLPLSSIYQLTTDNFRFCFLSPVRHYNNLSLRINDTGQEWGVLFTHGWHLSRARNAVWLLKKK